MLRSIAPFKTNVFQKKKLQLLSSFKRWRISKLFFLFSRKTELSPLFLSRVFQILHGIQGLTPFYVTLRKKKFPTKNDLPGGAGCVFLRQPIIVSHSKSRLSPLFFWTMDILKCIGDSAFQDEQDKQKIRLDFYGRSNSTGDIKNIFLFSEKREKQSCRPCFWAEFFKFCMESKAWPHSTWLWEKKNFRQKMTSRGALGVFFCDNR